MLSNFGFSPKVPRDNLFFLMDEKENGNTRKLVHTVLLF